MASSSQYQDTGVSYPNPKYAGLARCPSEETTADPCPRAPLQRSGQPLHLVRPRLLSKHLVQINLTSACARSLAVYSSVPVYEMMVRGIGVMRRRADSWLNATQILKVAGVDKGKRTKILEKDIAQGVHEKVQGGYGRYQGTWCACSPPFNAPPASG